jgi:hypothetical protein
MKLPALGVLVVASLLVPTAAIRAAEQSAAFDCTVEGGTRQVTALLAAFSSGSESRVRELISRPTRGRDVLELAPTFEAFAQGPAAAFHSDLQERTKAELGAFMHAVSGHTFKVLRSSGGTGTNMQTGPGAWTGPAVVLGVAWQAQGDGPEMRSHNFVSGDSKILVTCPAGKIRRALFSPNAIGPTPQSLTARP